MDLALNNLQRLICHKNQTNQHTKQISSNLFKNDITYKLFTYKSYVYPFKCVRTNDWC